MKMHITTTGGRIKVNGRTFSEMTSFEKSFLNDFIRETKNDNFIKTNKNERRNSTPIN